MSEYIKNGRYEDKNGNVEWYKDGLLHRENGPALEYSIGTKIWCLNGKRHREDGPAFEWFFKWFSGGQAWYLHGIEYTEDEFNKWLEKKKLNEKLNVTLNKKTTVKKVKI